MSIQEIIILFLIATLLWYILYKIMYGPKQNKGIPKQDNPPPPLTNGYQPTIDKTNPIPPNNPSVLDFSNSPFLKEHITYIDAQVKTLRESLDSVYEYLDQEEIRQFLYDKHSDQNIRTVLSILRSKTSESQYLIQQIKNNQRILSIHIH